MSCERFKASLLDVFGDKRIVVRFLNLLDKRLSGYTLELDFVSGGAIVDVHIHEKDNTRTYLNSYDSFIPTAKLYEDLRDF